jgi:hypothetical protein
MNPIEEFLIESREMTLEWYKQADAKAQAVLGFTGVFLSLIVGAVLSSESDSVLVGYLNAGPGGATRALFLFLPIPFFCASVVLSAAALWSRGVFDGEKKGIHFFGHLTNYMTKNALSDGHERELRDAIDALKTDIARHVGGGERSIEELAQDVLTLSRNTRLKHRLTNLAAAFSGAALIAMLVSLSAIALSVVKAG